MLSIIEETLSTSVKPVLHSKVNGALPPLGMAVILDAVELAQDGSDFTISGTGQHFKTDLIFISGSSGQIELEPQLPVSESE